MFYPLFEVSPEVLIVLCMDLRVCWVHKVFRVVYHVVRMPVVFQFVVCTRLITHHQGASTNKLFDEWEQGALVLSLTHWPNGWLNELFHEVLNPPDSQIWDKTQLRS